MMLPEIGAIEAFAMIVDINGFTPMVSNSVHHNDSIAQFIRDVLSGGIEAVEKEGGIVVGFMGDAFLAVLDDVESVYKTCVGIAHDLDQQCEYISGHQRDFPDDWGYSHGGVSLKIGIEHGWIDVSTIYSNFLGTQRILIGPPINYAARIITGGQGNRCNVGPEAMKHGMDQWWNSGPYSIGGKSGEGKYVYWEMSLGEVWPIVYDLNKLT